VYNEFSMAVEIGIPVIPVQVEAIRLPLWVRHLQIIHFHRQTNWAALLEAVKVSAVNQIPQQTSSKTSTMPVSEANPIPQQTSSKTSTMPRWASDQGHDDYGRYADLIVKEVTQRFRWIEAGRFMMGSPDDEKERLNWEGHHQVTLSEGFWLADTACTQVLWQAVMDDNPAHFKNDLQNPVEKVSWLDVQDFLKTLNQQSPALNAQLPSEAQWEYACRAATSTPFSFGKNITTDQVNFDGGHPYANGKEGECRDKTMPVKALPANQWGLYQMHGNVWEWCQDRWQTNLGIQAETDPLIQTGDDTGVRRVIRGGSWNDRGRDVRSAYRNYWSAVSRDDFVGFRLRLGL